MITVGAISPTKYPSSLAPSFSTDRESMSYMCLYSVLFFGGLLVLGSIMDKIHGTDDKDK